MKCISQNRETFGWQSATNIRISPPAFRSHRDSEIDREVAAIVETRIGKLDEQKLNAFTGRMLETLNNASLALMLSLGHRTGLLDKMATLPPSTSQQIADAAKLNERYVREWLGALAVARVVHYEENAGTYWLPPEHAALLTRAATPNNMASAMQWFAVLGGVEDRVLDCFHKGGGVHYCQYSRFHEVMAEESGQTVVAGLMEHILPMVPDVLSMLYAGIDVLDVGCGSGRAMIALAELFPNSRFHGYDFGSDAVARANEMAAQKGLKNVRFEAHDAAKLDKHAAFDLITAFDAIHDQAEPARVLDGISRALKPGGLFLMQDIAASSHVHKNMEHPLGAMLYTISTMHCMSVSLANNGAGLGTCWGEELAVKMLNDAGFKNVDVRKLPHDILNNYYLARKS